MKPPSSAKKPSKAAAGGPAKVKAAAADEAKASKAAAVLESVPLAGPPSLKPAQIKKAVDALLKHLKNEKAGATSKAALFDDDNSGEFIYLAVALKRTPEARSVKPHRIRVPHPLYTVENTEACLIVKDHDGEGHETAKKRIGAAERCGVTKVLGVSKLRNDYKGHEARRQLCASYDLFLADSRVTGLLPKLLGKAFFKRKKQPVAVDLTAPDWAATVRRALSGTYLHFSGGSHLVLRAARASMPAADIAANVMAVACGVAGAVPRKWANIQALFIKTTESVALPIYSALPELPAAAAVAAAAVVEEDE